MYKLLCLKCGEIYDKSLKPLNDGEYNFCPKSSCIGEIVEVDEMILPVIRILNLKCGFVTLNINASGSGDETLGSCFESESLHEEII